MNNKSPKFAFEDFALSLAKLTAPSQHVWVGSGCTIRAHPKRYRYSNRE